MNDWFEWNGVRCTQYGIHVSELPPPTIPSERATYTNVPGRPGSLTTLEGEDVYEDVVLTAQCFLSDPTKIPAIAAWLKGSGKVAFANRQGGFYYARIANQISFEKILRGNPHRSFAVNFRSKPFWYQADLAPVTLTTSTSTSTTPAACIPSRSSRYTAQATSLSWWEQSSWNWKVFPAASRWIQNCRKPIPARRA